MLALIRGAGDIASGIALRLRRSGVSVVMTDLPQPTSIRRTVAFSEAIRKGTWKVEGITARLAASVTEAGKILAAGEIPVLVDPDCLCLEELRPDVLVDAILAKSNLGTRITDAPVVIGVGPGFTAGVDCHAVIETMRGHTLGRVCYTGTTLPNTAVPGRIGGYTGERVLRAPADGIFEPLRAIGDTVQEGECVATVAGVPMVSTISGVLRGLLAEGVTVTRGMKSGDVDPRGNREYCFSASDKAIAVGGGVLEAILHFSEKSRRETFPDARETLSLSAAQRNIVQERAAGCSEQPLSGAGCVIMASGLGTRFGGNKLTADFDGHPVISWVLDATEDLSAHRVVVTRHAEVAALCRERGVRVIVHDLPNRNDTVRLGLRALEAECSGCLFCPGDQPLLTRESVRRLAREGIEHPSAIVMLSYGSVIASPIWFPKTVFSELEQLPTGKGGRYVAAQHPELVRFAEAGSPSELWDIDTQKDLSRLLALKRAEG